MTRSDNYAIRTLRERLDYLDHRSKPNLPNTERRAAELRAAIAILTSLEPKQD